MIMMKHVHDVGKNNARVTELQVSVVCFLEYMVQVKN
jgi:hypothetical protein